MQIITPLTHDLGAFEVRRTLPHEARTMVGPFTLLVALGDASLDGEALDRYSLYILKPGQAMTLRATGEARVMLFGGEAFTTPRLVWWNFVSSSRDRVNQAKDDWRSGRFATVPGDSEEFIPIPEVPKTVSYP